MDSGRKKTIQLRVKLPNLESLRVLSSELPTISLGSFVHKFGNILDFLHTKVQVDAITAFAQFYDPYLRCFLFQDFLLAPTLEEFEMIMDTPKENKGPFVEMGDVPKPGDLARALNLSVQ